MGGVVTTVSEAERLRRFLDDVREADSLISRLARGEKLSDSKFNAAIKRCSERFCGDFFDKKTHALIREEYHRRRLQAEAVKQQETN